MMIQSIQGRHCICVVNSNATGAVAGPDHTGLHIALVTGRRDAVPFICISRGYQVPLKRKFDVSNQGHGIVLNDPPQQQPGVLVFKAQQPS